jgi:hypothetical protein
VIGVGVGLDAFARGYATFGLLGRPGGLPGAMVVAWATNFTWILGLGLLPLVLLLFPDGDLPTPRWRPLAWLILVLAVALPLEGAVSPGSLQLFPFLDNPVGVTGGALGWLVEAFGQVGFQLFLGTLPAAALALALRFHRSRGVERQQLKWFAAAGLILVAVPVADTISPFGFDSNRLIELLSTWPLYVAIGIAILRYRLYDIDRLLNRTLVYGLLTVILGLGYSGAVLVAGQLFGGSAASRRTGRWPERPWPRRLCSSRSAAASRRSWTDGSTGAATMPRPPSRGSPPACASSSTWTRCPTSSWRWSTRPWSQPGHRSGCGRRRSPPSGTVGQRARTSAHPQGGGPREWSRVSITLAR